MAAIKFSKMVATGNDFIVIDNLRAKSKEQRAKIAHRLCHRRLGIGADGLLLVEKSRIADFKMLIFNPDGSEAKMCGNGSRCIALYAKIYKLAGAEMDIETKAGIIKAKARDNLVKINITEPKDIKLGIDVEVNGKRCQLHFIDTGVPHAVVFVDDINKVDVGDAGRAFRYHRIFAPHGTNVDFVQPKTGNAIFMRTYERGVEAETLACGTGAAASAIISAIIKGFNSPVKVDTKGGALIISFKNQNCRYSNVSLEGEAKEVFRGEIELVFGNHKGLPKTA